jgi:predicted dehydrogenase
VLETIYCRGSPAPYRTEKERRFALLLTDGLLQIPEDRAYETYQQMAEREANRPDRVDVVTIVTPNYLHFPIAKAFAELSMGGRSA